MAADPSPQPFASPEYLRRHAEVLYWSYRRTLSYLLLITMLGVVVFVIGLLALGTSVGFVLVLVSVILGIAGFVGYLLVEGLAANALQIYRAAASASGPRTTDPPEKEFCAYCGNAIPLGSAFCRYCGTKLR